MYEVIYRQPPFHDIGNLLDVSEAVKNGQRPFLDSSIHLYPEIFIVFSKCWDVNPENRYGLPEIVEMFSKLKYDKYTPEDQYHDKRSSSKIEYTHF